MLRFLFENQSLIQMHIYKDVMIDDWKSSLYLVIHTLSEIVEWNGDIC